jgi:hypothetical protein
MVVSIRNVSLFFTTLARVFFVRDRWAEMNDVLLEMHVTTL